MPHIGGNIIAFDDFQNAFKFIAFDAVMKVVTECLKIFFFIYNLVRTVAKETSQFRLYGQIWFNRAYTYECAVEEMPAGYGDTLMSVSPAWAFPVVVTVGMILSVWIANISMKMHKAVEKS